MTPDHFIALQSKIGCNNRKLAEWMDVSDETVSSWRTGKTKIRGPAAVLVEALASGWRPL